VFSQKPDGANGPLKAQHRLPVQTGRQQNGIADGLFQFGTRRSRRNRLPVRAAQNVSAASQGKERIVTR
jgi:hypothetical protein